MSESGENRVWSPEDIVNNASNWSLAADKELLRHLYHLSEKILSNAARTNDNLVGLIDSLDKTGLSLDLANIELENLHHTQFIESRVYDDDDEFEADEVNDVQVKVDKKTEEEKIRKEIAEGLLQAVKAVEEYYEYKEVPNSDSDDETDSPNFVWQPKDPYLTRPLPSVIGTTEWYRKWHVGLLDDSSDDEDVNSNVKAVKTLKDDVNSQSSDDERYLPCLDRRSTIPSNKEDERNSRQWRPSDIIDINSKNGLNPMANSTLVPDTGLFSENSEKGGSLPIQEPNLSFAEQLAQKLGNIAQAQESAKPADINTRPMKKAPTNTDVNVFFDEPPPICADDSSDSSDDAMFGKPGSSGGGLFGRSDAGLFDELKENETFWGESNVTDRNKAEIKKTKLPEAPPPVSIIFDNDSEAECDLFAPKPAAKMATSKYLPKSYMSMPLFDDEPPELPQKEKKKKPVGGVSIFGNADIMKPGSIIKNHRQRSSDNTSELDVASSINKALDQDKADTNKHISEIKKIEHISSSYNKESVETKIIQTENKINPQKPREKVSLFDEDDNLFEDDLFSNISAKKFTSNLFDDDSVDDNDSSGLFYSSTVKRTNEKINIFDKTQDIISSRHKKSDLFDDLPQNNATTNANSQNKVSTDIFDSSSNVKSDILKSEPAKSLFDGSDDLKGMPVERLNLFDNEIAQLDDDKSSNDKPEPSKRSSLFTNFKSSQVKNDQPEPAKRRNLFEDDVLTSAIDTTLSNAQIALVLEKNTTNIIKPNLFDDFDEPSSLFNDFSDRTLFDSEEIVKIDGNIKVQAKERVPPNDENVIKEPISSIPTKNIDYTANVSKIFEEIAVESVVEPVKSVITGDLSQNLTDISLFDTPPDIEDDFDTDSENNLFNDENHLIFEDDSNELSAPVYRSGIFDEEPPLLPSDDVKIKKSTSLCSIEATPSENMNNNEPVLSDISIVDDICTPQLKRSNISIHERLNSIETSNFDKVMDEPKDSIDNAENNKIFSDNSAEKNLAVKSAAEDDEKLTKIEPIVIKSLNTSPRKFGAPGKIKHNLNISVAALLPASSRKPEKAKTIKPQGENTTEAVATNNEQNLDELDNKTEVLQCITKDRAKIPVKRRPSTRKGRIETSTKSHEETFENNNKIITSDEKSLPIRKEILITDLINQNTVESTKNVTVESAKPKGAVKKPTATKQPLLFASSDSSDSDDIFKTKSLKSTKSKNIQPVMTKKPSDIFNGLKEQSLFDKQPVIKGDVFESPDYKKSKIFFDDDEENVDDYFSSKKLPPKSIIMKKSLFDDEEEGDDLFQSNLFKNAMKPAKMSGPVKKTSKATPLFAVTDTTDDPLDLFK